MIAFISNSRDRYRAERMIKDAIIWDWYEIALLSTSGVQSN
jgi:hypothetical protein